MTDEIIHRPDDLPEEEIPHGCGQTHVENALMSSLDVWHKWALHLESRLAKYETFAPSPKPGATIVTKHTAFDPDSRPQIMSNVDDLIQADMYDDDTGREWGRMALRVNMLASINWARHLESVREGMAIQLGHYERQEKQRLERELAERQADGRDRSSDN